MDSNNERPNYEEEDKAELIRWCLLSAAYATATLEWVVIDI